MRVSSASSGRADDQDRAPRGSAWALGDLRDTSPRTDETRASPRPWTSGSIAARCSDGSRSVGTDRIWNGPGIGVIERGEALERSLSLGFGHELEIERSELQAGA